MIRVGRFSHLSAYISLGGQISDELPSRIPKTRLAFTNWKHVCRRRDTRSSANGRVYAVVSSVLVYGSKAWPLRAGDMRKISVFEHCRLCGIDRTER